MKLISVLFRIGGVKKLLLAGVLLLGIIPSSVEAQNAIMDQMYEHWLDDSLPDSIRYNYYAKYLNDLAYNDPDSCIQLGEIALEDVRNFGMRTIESDLFGVLAGAWSWLGNNAKSDSLYEEGFRIAEQVNYQQGILNYYNNVGLAQMERGNLAAAVELLTKNLAYREREGLKAGNGATHHNLSICYAKLGDTESALRYSRKALDIRLNNNDPGQAVFSYFMIGSIYADIDSDSGEYYLQKSIHLGEQVGRPRIVAFSSLNLATELVDQGKLDSVLHYADLACENFIVVGDSMHWHISNLAKAEYHLALGEFQDAVDIALTMPDTSKYPDIAGYHRLIFDNLSKGYKGLGDYALALEYLEKCDSIDNQAGLIKTAQELEEFEAEIQALKDSVIVAGQMGLLADDLGEKKNQRNLFIIIGLIAAAVAFLIFFILKKTRKAKAASELILDNVLPTEISEELKAKGTADAKSFDQATILFSDFKGFTKMSEEMSSDELLKEINHCFQAFDHIVGKYRIEKIKTIGDAYMAAGGLPNPGVGLPHEVVQAGLEMQEFITNRKKERETENLPAFAMRIGIHTGPVIAGIVGVKKYQYDVWGDTVNTASRMESSGEAGMVNISEATYELVKDQAGFQFESRGKIEAKGKGELEMYFVSLD